MKKQVDYYGTDANYIHLKFGDARKMYNFTKDFKERYPLFAQEYIKYWNDDKTCKFKTPFAVVHYVYSHDIPVLFYFNYTDTPAKDEQEIMIYLVGENSFTPELE